MCNQQYLLSDPMPSFMDFEASGLAPDSYPIQVAWSLGDVVESHLILPAPEWTHWDYNAESMHQIRRESLLREGKPLGWIADRMNAQLAGTAVYCDGGIFDQLWLFTLYEFAERKPAFELLDASQCFIRRAEQLGIPFGELERRAWAQVVGRRHDAATDVRYLQALFCLLALPGEA